MEKNLYDFLDKNNIEVRVDDPNCNVYCFIPFYLLEDFVNSCVNDELAVTFEGENHHRRVILFEDCLMVELDDIIWGLEEDVDKYKKLAKR